jgi:site-specific DNA-adenine methylase
VDYQDGRELYNFLKDKSNINSEFDIAVRFFIMNRITFSGIMDSGGYSQQAFEKRFTESSIERLKIISNSLSSVTQQFQQKHWVTKKAPTAGATTGGTPATHCLPNLPKSLNC